MQPWHIARIAAIGVCSGRVGRRNQALIGHRSSFIVYPIGPQLDIVDLANGYSIEVDHVATDVRQQSFLAEKEATTVNPMFQRDALYGKTLVFVNNLLHRGIYGMKHHFELDAATKEI